MPKPFDPFAQPMPSDELSERFLIATAIQWENRLREAVIALRPEYFSSTPHRVIWSVACEMYDSGKQVSRESILAHFSTGPGSDQLETIGGVSYLSNFLSPAPDTTIADYVEKIIDTYSRRLLMLKCNEAMSLLVDRQMEVTAISQELEEHARSTATLKTGSSGFKDFEETIRECGGLEAFLSRRRGDTISYPWPTLNRMTQGGMRPGQLIVIAGPSGKGKTALAMNIVFRASYSGTGVPLVFSLEMQKEEIAERMLSLASSVDSYTFDRLTTDQRDDIRNGRSILAENRYLVDDEDSASMAAIRSKTKTMISRERVSVVVIDTIQLVQGKRSAGENREQELASITRSMKRMAMQLKVPVIGLSQITDLEFGKEPELKNLRESRAIGHNANLVMFIHFTRPYEMPGTPIGELDLILAKHRSGAEGRLKLEFHAPTGRVYEREGVNGGYD